MIIYCIVITHPLSFDNFSILAHENKQPVITSRIDVLYKIKIALKFMSYINSDLPIPAEKLQTPG